MDSATFREKNHAEFQKLLETPIMQQAIIAVMLNRPSAKVDGRLGGIDPLRNKEGSMDPAAVARRLGMIAGYEEAIYQLQLLALPPEPKTEDVRRAAQNYNQPKPPADVPPPVEKAPELAPAPEENKAEMKTKAEL